MDSHSSFYIGLAQLVQIIDGSDKDIGLKLIIDANVESEKSLEIDTEQMRKCKYFFVILLAN